jgi:hypothetical protein
VQIAYDDPAFPLAGTAYILKKSCGSSAKSVSIGWCPQYGAASCDYQYGETFCKSVYGGQLATPATQREYDEIVAVVGGPAVHPADHPCGGCESSGVTNAGCGCGCATTNADGTCGAAGEDGYNEQHLPGRNRYGAQAVHLNPQGLCLHTSTPCAWSILSACLPF